MPTIIRSVSWWREIRKNINIQNKSVGFIPTMGALHDGHISLAKSSISENDITIVSIFINPTQFDDPFDLKHYPKSFHDDHAKLKELGINYIFFPKYEELYPDNFRYRINENEISKILCGAKRPGHFDGVLTVVMKLLNIIKPTNAYFGEKDFQQLKLIKDMVNAFFLDTNIIGRPIVREPSGLALSSRNEKISNTKRKDASMLYHQLKQNKPISEIKKSLKESGLEVDYVEEHFNRRFGAVKVDNVRIIDNVSI